MTVLKLILVLVVIAIGIRRKIFVGYLLCGVGLALPFLFGQSWRPVLEQLYGTTTGIDFWRLYGAIVIVTVLGNLLKKIGALDRLTDAAQHLAGGKRTATAVLPAAIGLMPMPGGALMSAPMVGQVLKDDGKSPEYLSAVNYWYRHVMEFFWPLYPGIILGAGICGLSQQTFSALGIVMSLIMISIGYIFFLRHIGNGTATAHSLKSLGRIFIALWPLFLAVAMTLTLRIDIVISLTVAVIVTVVVNRGSLRHLLPAIGEAVTVKLFFMVFGILVFKDMLELSGAVANMPTEVARLGIPPAVIIFVVTFLTGMLSGMVAMYVGLCFPVLSGFLYADQINLGNIFLTYLSGYLGVILSPTHFCLLLTSEYFKADLGKVYRKILPPVVILGLCGLILYLTGYPWGLLGN